MKKAFPVLVGLFLLLMSGCSQDDDQTATPTATPGPVATHVAMSLTDLATDPTGHAGRRVLVSGRFAQLPVPVCNGTIHVPPTSWALSDQGIIIQAAGLEEMIFPLAPNDLTMLVAGNWKSWTGLIGCGNAAIESTIWFLDADRIAFPNPLSKATLTPYPGQQTGLDSTLLPTMIPQPSAEQIPSMIATQPLATVQTTATASPEPGTAASTTPTATPSLSNTSDPAQTVSPIPTATSLVSPLQTPTTQRLSTLDPPASPTLDPSPTPLPTFTPYSESTLTSTPTSTPPASSTLLDRGSLDLDVIENGVLGNDETHRWLFSGSDVITISVAAESSIDISITVRNPAGDDIEKKDNALAGDAEVISGLELPDAGDYQILVSDINGLPGSYSVVVNDVGSWPYIFPGNLNYNSELSTDLPADSVHIWHFMGQAGDYVRVQVLPNDGSDSIFLLFDPAMKEIDYVDLAAAGDPESAEYTLAATGMYSVWVEEYGGEPSSYRISVTE